MNGIPVIQQAVFEEWRADRFREAEQQRMIHAATTRRRSWFRWWSVASRSEGRPAAAPESEAVVVTLPSSAPAVHGGLVDLRAWAVPAPRPAPADEGVAPQVG